MNQYYRRGKSVLVFFSLLIIIPFSLLAVSFAAYGESSAWNCPECGRTGNTGNYCGGCAHPAPWIESSTDPALTDTSGRALAVVEKGFGGDVTVHVEMNDDGTVKALSIDTPDEVLGKRVSEAEFTEQFIGKAAPFVLGGNGIEALSGATVTSKAAVKAINQTVAGEEPAPEATEEPKPQAKEAAVTPGHVSSLPSIKEGYIIAFGTYPQTKEGTDQTPIEWIVLDYDEANHKALLLSKYGLDTKLYNTYWTDVTWENCSLRTWLNGKFLNKAFSAEEQSAILITDVDNSPGQGNTEWNTDSGNNTQDRIFLLSYNQARHYLSATLKGSNKNNIRIAPTAYAIGWGAWTSASTQTEEGTAAGWWWLRSPGYSQREAANVRADGSLGDTTVTDKGGTIRPALWLNLESDN